MNVKSIFDSATFLLSNSKNGITRRDYNKLYHFVSDVSPHTNSDIGSNSAAYKY